MNTHKERLRREAIDKLAAYFDSLEQFDKEVSYILYDVRHKLVQTAERKEREATKEWLSEYWVNLPWNKAGTPLEEEEWFIEWLDEVNHLGHQYFLRICEKCDGTGDAKGIAGQVVSACAWCKGTGKRIGPDYCFRCKTLFSTCGARCPGRAHY